MKECPTCKRELKDHLFFCPFDGHALAPKVFIDRLIGVVLDDKYRIEEKIGEGGMGTVYRATHIHMANTVAIKVLHAHLSADATAVERFRREASAAAFIRHPNAVAVTDFGVTKEQRIAYLVMEFLEGVELRERMKGKQLDYEETLNILQQTCSAVNAAHSKGIIHRDLKPDNIWLLVDEDGVERVKVLDFGIAKLKTLAETSNLTQQGMIVGTPHYMSPEQCRGDELDARSDIYSLGVVAYEMLTGDVPFRAPTPMGVVLKHEVEAPRPLRECRSDIPFEVEQVILRALHKAPEARQDSAIKLAQELESAMVGAGIDLTNLLRTPQSLDASIPPPDVQRTSTTQGGGTGGTPAYAQAPGQGQPTPAESFAAQTPGAAMPLGIGTQPGALSPHTAPHPFRATQPQGPLIAIANNKKLLALAIAAGLAMLLVGAVGIGWWLTNRSGGKSAVNDRGERAAKTDPAAATPEGMVYVPAGKFIMGNNASDSPADKPEHYVEVGAFYIDKYEVTNEQFYQFLKVNTGREPPSEWPNGVFPKDKAKHPVTGVSYLDAQEYARSVQKRLPTEVEWEYAARGADKRLYPWGNQFDSLRANVLQAGEKSLVDVGRYSLDQSPFGVFDMAGNAAEWTASTYQPYESSTAKPAPDTIVVRGGCYSLDKKLAMVTHRFYAKPEERRSFVGFRCARRAVAPK